MSPTRRRLLLSTLPATVGLAGCMQSGAPADPNGDESRGTERNPDVHKPRNLEDGPVLAEPDGNGGINESHAGFRRTLVTSQAEADGLAFGDGVPEADVESTRTFFAETDFAEETIYVSQVGVESCSRYRIRSVSWEPERVEYEHCTELRPPDHDCTAGARERVALCIRLPVSLAMTVRSAGASGRTPCQHTDTAYETIDPNETADGTGATGE